MRNRQTLQLTPVHRIARITDMSAAGHFLYPLSGMAIQSMSLMSRRLSHFVQPVSARDMDSPHIFRQICEVTTAERLGDESNHANAEELE